MANKLFACAVLFSVLTPAAIAADALLPRHGETYSQVPAKAATSEHRAESFQLPEGTLTLYSNDTNGALAVISLENAAGGISVVTVDSTQERSKNNGDADHEVRCILCYTNRQTNQSWGFYGVYRNGKLIGYLIIQPDGKMEFKGVGSNSEK